MYLEFYVKNRDETSMKHFGLKIELKDCPYHQTNLERWIFLYFMNTKDFKNSFASTFVKYLKCKHHQIQTFSQAKIYPAQWDLVMIDVYVHWQSHEERWHDNKTNLFTKEAAKQIDKET